MAVYLQNLPRELANSAKHLFGLPITEHKDMTGMKCLRMYAALCALPSMKLGSDAPAMPAPGHRAHCNALSVRPEHWRKLRGIALMDRDRMDAAVVDCKCSGHKSEIYLGAHVLPQG